MVDIRPFRGLRYSETAASSASDVLAPPYDVISPAEHRELLARSPLNVVRIELPAEDGGDKYQRAAATLSAWRSEGVLARDERPSFYLYETRFGLGEEERVRRSLVAGVRLDPWEAGQVLPHERTDESDLYPSLARLLGGQDPMGSMSRTHREIHHLCRLFGRLVADGTADGPSADERRDLRRVLYGLDAILRLHYAQEEELYETMTDEQASATP